MTQDLKDLQAVSIKKYEEKSEAARSDWDSKMQLKEAEAEAPTRKLLEEEFPTGGQGPDKLIAVNSFVHRNAHGVATSLGLQSFTTFKDGWSR